MEAKFSNFENRKKMKFDDFGILRLDGNAAEFEKCLKFDILIILLRF